jgi:hypothetical protein
MRWPEPGGSRLAQHLSAQRALHAERAELADERRRLLDQVRDRSDDDDAANRPAGITRNPEVGEGVIRAPAAMAVQLVLVDAEDIDAVVQHQVAPHQAARVAERAPSAGQQDRLGQERILADCEAIAIGDGVAERPRLGGSCSNAVSRFSMSTQRSLSVRKRGPLELQLNDRTALAGSAPRTLRNTRRVAEKVPRHCARSSRVTVHHP